MAADLPQPPTPLAEISQGPGAFERFLDRNQALLIALTILLVIAAAALVVYRGINQSREETAGAALVKAADPASLQAVIEEHAATPAAASAMVLLADMHWSEGRQDDAITTLREFIATRPGHPAMASAQASLGSKLMAQGKAADAAQVFQQIADDPQARFLAPFALISLGDIARTGGDPEKAATFYNKVKTEHPESGFTQTATSRIATLKAKPPVEVEPAPPAPAADASAPAATTAQPEAPAPPAAEGESPPAQTSPEP